MEEDGKLKYCGFCGDETPHTEEQVDDHKEWVCEFCRAKYEESRFEMPVIRPVLN